MFLLYVPIIIIKVENFNEGQQPMYLEPALHHIVEEHEMHGNDQPTISINVSKTLFIMLCS